MAKQVSAKAYTNGKGVKRVQLFMDEAFARKLAGYDGEKEAKLANTQAGEALIAVLSTEAEEAS